MQQLTEEQVRTMTLEEKDRWWLENVYKGDMPQLTVRSALTGMLLGGLLSLTNLYIGIKTGWTLGVGITSVIMSFAIFKFIAKLNMGSEITLLENNAMQSIATAAGYMTGPLVSSIAAYMMITGKLIPVWQVMLWTMCVSMLGVLFAFPLKKRYINDEQMPFPEGKACGVVMYDLHSDDPKEGAFKIKVLLSFAGFSALYKILSSSFVMKKIGLAFLMIPHHLDNFVYKLFHPKIMGVSFKELTIRLESDVVMLALGGLMGIRTGLSLFVGAVVNYFILAPILIKNGIILPKGGHYGFRQISYWSLWGGVAIMTAASLFSFFSKPKMIVDSFTQLFRKGEKSDVLEHIELPMRVFLIGIPLMGTVVVLLTHYFFGVSILMGMIALPLIFVFTVIAVHSTGLTGITPTGALGKLTQLTYAVISPNNITTNVMTAGINGEVAGNASNLLMDIKPGYMLGAKPRQQAIGHIFGIIAGGLVATPVFFMLIGGDVKRLGGAEMPMISAKIWVGVAQILTKGISSLHSTALWAMVIGLGVGIVFEILKIATKAKFPVSAVGVGLPFVLPFYMSLSMFLGSLLFWLAGRNWKEDSHIMNRIIVQNQETICAGVIAGGALLDITLSLLQAATK